ncbi:uncharacterized protein DSM5745_07914 [Aspergillus mulundensis]|uniref:Uncharacterized protein n=1 Tax=Aspergillus mulundensis TaxID=1810919 RepID=A0A3D8RFC8_9EURO|nr:Uncharacterized protein DSM5745_07914 [Aspergillus mulundensis]RDW72742.1 Uncharacterized protein DSM5745_07914 [Aspergillus mulundensis]
MFFLPFLLGSAAAQDAITSDQWLITLNTSIFWPTSTDYFYGPTTGPDASAVSCNAAWIEYARRSTELHSLGPTTTSPYYGSYTTSEGACRTSVTAEDWSDTHTGPLTTLCDGAPRALGPRETVTAYYPGTGPCSTWVKTNTYTSTLYRDPGATPDCTLEVSECIPIWSTYSELSSSYQDSIITSVPGDTNSPIRPWDCPTPTRSYPEENPCSACHFLPGTATLFYWPVTTDAGDLCLQNGTTLSPSGPSTAIVNGETFVSPTVYLSFTTIYAWSNRRAHPGSQCGEDHYNTVVAVNPETLTSMRHHRNAKYPYIGTAYPFNFAEFQPHEIGNYTQSLVPWPQYRGGQQCPIPDDSTCTMIRDDYVPWVKIPEEVRSIDPGWSVCDDDWYIPPVTMVALDREEITITPTPEVAEQRLAWDAAAPGEGLAATTPEPTRGW